MATQTVTTGSFYVVYRTVATETEATGTITNVISYDGSSTYDPGAGLALAADPQRSFKIGDVFDHSTLATSGATSGG